MTTTHVGPRLALLLSPVGDVQAGPTRSAPVIAPAHDHHGTDYLGPPSRHPRAASPYLNFPVLYNACRKVKGSRLTSAQAVKISKSAMSEANKYGESKAQNSFRHFIWQAALTARFGARIAAALGHRWEKGHTGLDSKVDLRNNSVGRMFGDLFRSRIREGLEDHYPWSYLHELWFQAYEDHLLWVEINRKVVRSCLTKTKDYRCVSV